MIPNHRLEGNKFKDSGIFELINAIYSMTMKAKALDEDSGQVLTEDFSLSQRCVLNALACVNGMIMQAEALVRVRVI